MTLSKLRCTTRYVIAVALITVMGPVSTANLWAQATQPVAPRSIPLRIDFGGSRPGAPYPVRGGVPFARGELTNAESLRLLCGTEEVDCQVARLAVWPDGSLKWVKLDFFATPGQSFVLTYDKGAKRAAVSRPIQIAEGE
ncbi:unnamed protein product, partial [marine sediment metagenome]